MVSSSEGSGTEVPAPRDQVQRCPALRDSAQRYTALWDSANRQGSYWRLSGNVWQMKETIITRRG